MHYTCNSCKLEFPDLQGQKEHMRSDWHRYNLKRRVAQLPPVDEETFRSKVSVHADGDASANEPKDRESKKEARRKAKESIREQKRQLLETARRSMTEESNVENPTVQKLELKEESPVLQQDELSIPEDKVDEETSPEPSQEDLIKEKMENRLTYHPLHAYFARENTGRILLR